MLAIALFSAKKWAVSSKRLCAAIAQGVSILGNQTYR
jgi:hypothetical protein